MDAMGATILATPDLSDNPKVDAVRNTFLIIANTCFILFVIFAGYVVTTRETLHTRYGVKELLPRLVIGFAAANLSAMICSRLIWFANALTAAIVGQGVDGPSAATAISQALSGGSLVGTSSAVPGASGFLLSMLLLAALVIGLVVVITWCLRLGMLLILVGVAPMALAFHATPQTEGLAFAWWRSFIAVLGIQIGQAIVLLATVRVFLTPDGPVVNGMPASVSGMLGICMAISMLWLMLKIPGWMKHFVMGPLRGKGAISQVIQTVAAIKTLGVSAAALTATKSSAKRAAAPTRPAPARPTPARLTPPPARPAPRGAPAAMFSHAPLTHAPTPGPTGTVQPQFSHPTPPVPGSGGRSGTAMPGFSHPQTPQRPLRASTAPASRPKFSHPDGTQPLPLRPPQPKNPATATVPTPVPAVFSHPQAAHSAPKRPPAPVTPVFSNAPKPTPKPAARRSRPKKES